LSISIPRSNLGIFLYSHEAWFMHAFICGERLEMLVFFIKEV